jgi:hypothetical protein
LLWHHFDPPWRDRQHHEPEGMIALCSEHHDQADAGAFTTAQLKALKASRMMARGVEGRFNWMRNKLLAVVGGNFFYETPVIFQFRGEPAIWFNRDDEGNFLLNVRMLTVSGEPRMRIEDNFWLTRGPLEDLECPPSGRLLHGKYANGDDIRVEFFELGDVEALNRRYPEARADGWVMDYPITAVEITTHVGQTEVAFGRRWRRLPGNNVLRNCFMSHCGVGIAMD